MGKDIFKITDLIYRKFVDDLSEEENKELKNWIESDDKNMLYYQKLFTEFSIEKVKKLSVIDINSAWKKYNKKYKKRISLSGILRYAALIILILSVGGFIYYSHKNKPLEQMYATKVIAPGKHTAILKIQGKKDIELGSKIDIKLELKEGINITADSTYLSYKNADKETKKDKPVIHTLNTPHGGEFLLTLSDGTKVWVNSETVLKYPSYFEGNKRIVEIEGEAYFEVSKNKKKPFIVRTKGINIEVLGTQFNVNSYVDSEDIITTLIEGKVKVSSQWDNNSNPIRLTPGMQSVYNKISKKSEVRKNVNTELYTAWKRGFFMFKDRKLEDIMEEISRWYDIEVFYEDSDCKELKFTGEFKRYEDFNYISKFLKLTKKVEVRTKGKIVYIKSL